MARDWRIKNRRPVRRKQVQPLLDRLAAGLGMELHVEATLLELAIYGPWTLILVDREPVAIELEDPHGLRVAFPTLKGLLMWKPPSSWVSVDRGAIPFLLNGADCMSAGIQDCDPDIEVDQLVWIRDETHDKPIAVGWSLMSGSELKSSTSGKAVSTIHWIGDELWEMEL